MAMVVTILMPAVLSIVGHGVDHLHLKQQVAKSATTNVCNMAGDQGVGE
jgi:hypothetical protein